MLTATPPKFPHRRRRARRKRPVPAPPVAPLTLTAAELFADDQYIVLTFDRAVDISAIDTTAIFVRDGFFTLYQYYGTPGGATLESPTSVKLLLTIYSAWSDGEVRLIASDATGIVASGDGAAWAGAADLALPYP